MRPRAGEVSKCITVPHRQLIDLARRLSALLTDAWGPMCFQAFVDEAENVSMIELNPRLGGGYPIAHAAGANFLRWLIDDARGVSIPEPNDNWKSGVVMLRWDDAVFTTAGDVTQ